MVQLACKKIMTGLLPADAVFAVAWNPAQADIVASGGGDDTAYIWKVYTCTFVKMCVIKNIYFCHVAAHCS